MANKFTPEEKDQLVNVFEALDVKPKMDDPVSLQRWMADYLKGVSRTSDRQTDQDAPTHRSENTHLVHAPRISIFSGDEDKDSCYEAWKFEVMTLLKDDTFSDKVIATALKKSLRGDAASVVRRMGLNASIEDVMQKLEGIFGTVEDSECLLSTFYSAEQRPGEKVATWGCRLEDLLDRALQGQTLSSKSVDDMLKVKFWSGLQDHIKEGTRHLKNTVPDFDQLRVEARKVERERSGSRTQDELPKFKKSGQVKVMKAESECELEKMKGDICQMNTKISELHSLVMANVSPTHPPELSPSHRHFTPNQGRSSWTGNHSYNHMDRGQYRSRGRNWNQSHQAVSHQQRSHTSHQPFHRDQVPTQQHGEIICYRCKQPGHIAWGCRADLSQNHLNKDESA
jgi:hypothetical protein